MCLYQCKELGDPNSCTLKQCLSLGAWECALVSTQGNQSNRPVPFSQFGLTGSWLLPFSTPSGGCLGFESPVDTRQ